MNPLKIRAELVKSILDPKTEDKSDGNEILVHNKQNPDPKKSKEMAFVTIETFMHSF